MPINWLDDFPTNRPKRNALAAGLSSGVDDLQGLGYSAIGAVADAVGANGVRDWANERADINQWESQRNGRPDLERIEDVYNQPGKWLPYLGYQVAKQAPNIAGAIGVGLVTPEIAVPAALSRGAAMLPRWAGGGGMAGRVAAAGADPAAQALARDAAMSAGQTFGKQIVGGGAFNYAQGVGSLYQEGVEGGNPNMGVRSLLEGVPYAVTETLPEAMLVGRIGHGSGFKGGLPMRMAKSAGLQATSGATSELLQNEMEMGMRPDTGEGSLTDEQKFSQRLNSGVAGGLVEGVLGLPGGRRGPSLNVKRTPEGNVDLLNPGDAPAGPPNLLSGADSSGYIAGPYSELPGQQPNPFQTGAFAEMLGQKQQLENAMRYAASIGDAKGYYQAQDALNRLLLNVGADLDPTTGKFSPLPGGQALAPLEDLYRRQQAEQNQGQLGFRFEDQPAPAVDDVRMQRGLQQRLFGGLPTPFWLQQQIDATTGAGRSPTDALAAQFSPDAGVKPGTPYDDLRDRLAAEQEQFWNSPSQVYGSTAPNNLERELPLGDWTALQAGQLGTPVAGDGGAAKTTDKTPADKAAEVRAKAPEFLKKGGRAKMLGPIIGDGDPAGVAQRLREAYAKASSDETRKEVADNLAAWFKAVTGQDISAPVAKPAAASVASTTTPSKPSAVPAGFAYSLTKSPAYEGVKPLSADDADFELEALQNQAEKGRLTPEQFAGSEIGKRLDTAQVMTINAGLKSDPVGTIKALRASLKKDAATTTQGQAPNVSAPAAPVSAPAESSTAGAPVNQGSVAAPGPSTAPTEQRPAAPAGVQGDSTQAGSVQGTAPAVGSPAVATTAPEKPAAPTLTPPKGVKGTRTAKVGKLIDRIQGKTALIGGSVDLGLLKNALADEPLMHEAILLTLGRDRNGELRKDENGNVGKPLSAQAAAEAVGIAAPGSKNNEVSRVASALGLDARTRAIFARGSVVADKDAGVASAADLADAADQEFRSNWVEKEEYAAEPEKDESADGESSGKPAKGEGKQTKGKVETAKGGLITDARWYGVVREKGISNLSNAELADVAVKIGPYAQSNRPENRATLRAISDEVNKRSNNREFVRLINAAYNKEYGASATEVTDEEVREDERARATSKDDEVKAVVSGVPADAGKSGQQEIPAEVSPGEGDERGAPTERQAEQPAKPAPVVTTKKRRLIQKSSDTSDAGPVSITIEVNGQKMEFPDGAKSAELLQKKVERLEALLACLKR